MLEKVLLNSKRNDVYHAGNLEMCVIFMASLMCGSNGDCEFQ